MIDPDQTRLDRALHSFDGFPDRESGEEPEDERRDGLDQKVADRPTPAGATDGGTGVRDLECHDGRGGTPTRRSRHLLGARHPGVVPVLFDQEDRLFVGADVHAKQRRRGRLAASPWAGRTDVQRDGVDGGELVGEGGSDRLW